MSASSPGTGILDLKKKVGELEEKVEDLKGLINISYRLRGGTAIKTGDNLDNYISSGNYYCSQSAIAEQIQNCPTNNAFTLKVEDATGTAYPCQTLRDFHFGTLYYRYYTLSQNKWTEWRSLTPV